jgi:membrane protease YdiL (CAAX protease family)
VTRVRAALARWRDEVLRPLDKRLAVVLVLTPTLLVLDAFHGKPKAFPRALARLTEGLPLPALHPRLWFFLSAVVLLGIVPALVVRAGFRERLSAYGLGLGDRRAGARIALVFLAVMVPVAIVAARFPAFAGKYPLSRAAGDGALSLIVYEAGFLAYFAAWEFFFRGFLQFSLERVVGVHAVLLQSIPFVLRHVDKPEPEALGAVVAGIALGLLARETRSVWYGVFLHWGVALTMDLAALAGRGFFG